MGLGETGAMAVRMGIDDEIRVTLAIKRYRFGAVPAHRAKSHALEQFVQGRRIGAGIFDEFEAVGADRIFPKFHCGILVACFRRQYSFICNYLESSA